MRCASIWTHTGRAAPLTERENPQPNSSQARVEGFGIRSPARRNDVETGPQSPAKREGGRVHGTALPGHEAENNKPPICLSTLGRRR